MSTRPSIVAGHLKDWPSQDVWSVIADNGTDGALVYGDGIEDWRRLDLVATAVTLDINGETVRTGSGANVLGDPLEAFVWLANARSRDGDGLKAGDIHNTGTATSYGNAGVITSGSCVPQSLPGLWKSIPGMLFDPDGPASIRPGYFPKFLPWAIRFLKAGRADRVAGIARAISALNRPSTDIYRRHLSGTSGENLLRESIYIHAYRNGADAGLDGIGWRLRAENGAELERIGGDELRRLEPCLSRDYDAAILIRDQGRSVAPGRLGTVLAAKVRQSGGEIVEAGVQRIRPEQEDWAVDTDRGTFRSSQVVVSAGVWSRPLLEPLGYRVPLEAERGYHMMFRNPGVELGNSIFDADFKFVTSSMDRGIRSAGTAEFAGLDAPPNFRRARIFASLTKRMMPDLNTEDTEEWMGIRPSFPDSLPCIEEVPGHPGLFAAFGHSHFGLTMAPMTGRIIADLATGTSPNLDLAPYSSARF